MSYCSKGGGNGRTNAKEDSFRLLKYSRLPSCNASIYCYENEKNLDTDVLLLHDLTLKLSIKAIKTKQWTCLQIIALRNITTTNTSIKNGKQVNKNITTNTSIKNGKQVNKNITTNTKIINVNKIHKEQ